MTRRLLPPRSSLAALALLLALGGCGGKAGTIDVYDPAAASRYKIGEAEADCKKREGRYDDLEKNNDKAKTASILLAYRVGKAGPENPRVLCAFPNSDCVGDALDWVRHNGPAGGPVGTEMRVDYQYPIGDKQPSCKARDVNIVK